MSTPSSSRWRGLVTSVTAASVAHPGVCLLMALAIGAVSVREASQLEIRSSFQELLPEDLASVRQVKELLRRAGGDGTVLVLLEAQDGPSGLAAAEAMAPVLARDFQALGPSAIRSVEYDLREAQAWYEEHAPLFIDLGELIAGRDGLRRELRRARAAAVPLFVDLDADDETEPVAPEPAWLETKTKLPREQVAERYARYDHGFLVHPDHTSLTLVLRPAGTSLGVDESRELMSTLHGIVDRHARELAERHLRVGWGGTFPLFIAEYEAIVGDVAGTAALVLTLVLASLLAFFRDLRSSFALGTAVVTALAVTFGVTRVVIGYLNTQTAFLGAIVAGNGINYGLIYLARVEQLRAEGVPLASACVEGALTSARATLLAALASSVSFGVLIVAANRGFRHFGFIGGIGMLLCWLATFTLVPALLAVAEMVRAAPRRRSSAHGVPVGALLGRIAGHPRVALVAFAVLTIAAAGAFAAQLRLGAIEHNLDNLTNELPGRSTLADDNLRANGGLGASLAGAVALLPSPGAADRFCDVIRQRMKEARYQPIIEGCASLSSVVPADQPEKLAVMREMVAELTDLVLTRVQQPDRRERLRELRRELSTQRSVTTEDAPQVLVDRFRERDGTLGRLATVTARGDARLEVADNLQAFVRAVRDVPVDGARVDATGDNVVLADLLEDIEVEGPRTTLLSLLGVVLLVLLFFRELRTSVEVVGSLTVGVVLMCGAAAALGIKINFLNFVVLPITFGVAVDYGANVAARVRERAGDVGGALAEVGGAVALCSWTSVIGYSTLLHSVNRGLRSFGWYALVGELTSIVTALVLLPALLQLRARRSGSRQP